MNKHPPSRRFPNHMRKPSMLRRWWGPINRIFQFLAWHVGYLRFLLGRAVFTIWGVLETRSRMQRALFLMQGLPALGVAVCVATGSVLGMLSERDLAERYRREANSCLSAGSYQEAKTCLERLLDMGAAGEQDRYNLSAALDQLGEHERAAKLLAKLTPPDGRGFPPARLRLAKRLLADGPAPARLRQAEQQLLCAIREAPQEPGAHLLLGGLYWDTGRPELAEPHLKAGDRQPEANLALALLYKARSKDSQVRDRATRAYDEFAARAAAHPEDLSSRLNAARAAVLLDNYAGAAILLQAGLDRPAGAACRQALAKLYAAWAADFERQDPEKLADRLRLLEEGLAYDPSEPELLQQLQTLAQRRGKGADEARAQLEGLLTQGKGSAALHFVLGTDACARGRSEEALLHLGLAHQLAPQFTAAANNLAWALANAPQPDLHQALALSNAAIEMHPQEPEYRDTRGRILVRLGRWKEALPDLEAALSGLRPSADLHNALADTYEHLGVPSMAANHRNAAANTDVKK